MTNRARWAGIGLGMALALVAPAFGQSAASPPPAAQPEEDEGEWVIDVDRVRSVGEALFGAEAVAEIEAAAGTDLEALAVEVERVFHDGSIEQLAALKPRVEALLVKLRQVPWAEPYVEWLGQRLDYLDLAAQAVAVAAPPPAPAPVPAPKAPQKTPAPSPPAMRAGDIVRSTDVWRARIGRRPVPPQAARFVPAAKEIFRREGVPPEWVWLAEVESSWNPRARSPVGAYGLFQFMPATAERFGLKLRPFDERGDGDKSARAAARYLRLLHERFNSWPLALAAYNAGEGRVGRLLERHRATTFEGIADALPAETQMYVPKVLATVALREGVQPETLPPPRR